MSGGVDSSVTAALLQEQGYEPIGVFMCAGLAPDERAAGDEPSRGPRRCCSPNDSADARRVAMRLGIPFSVLDFAPDFDRLIERFCEDYGHGRTPNPCVDCNRDLKFGRLLEVADAAGARFVATGHYARVEWEAGRWRLKRGLDREKDQSYFLFAVPPDRLEHIRLPLGELTKPEVRRIARDLGLPVHDKAESQDVCFVRTAPADLVRERRPDLMRPGPVLDMDGREVARHEGVAHFTIGQRRGLGVAIRAVDATVVIGPVETLRSPGLVAERVIWHETVPMEPLRAEVQIRYRHAAAPAWITRLDEAGGGRAEVRFDEPQPAVTPGQAAVFYREDRVLGGGWITASRL